MKSIQDMEADAARLDHEAAGLRLRIANAKKRKEVNPRELINMGYLADYQLFGVKSEWFPHDESSEIPITCGEHFALSLEDGVYCKMKCGGRRGSLAKDMDWRLVIEWKRVEVAGR